MTATYQMRRHLVGGRIRGGPALDASGHPRNWSAPYAGSLSANHVVLHDPDGLVEAKLPLVRPAHGHRMLRPKASPFQQTRSSRAGTPKTPGPTRIPVRGRSP
ncbi:hypothetical protein GCM10023324_56010 [Streptomyces youssoufiensis]